MKSKILITAFAIVIGGTTGFVLREYTDHNASAATETQAKQCPTNTYRIGGTDSEPTCKTNPTGCPYGENIPVDSPKCIAPSDPNAYAPWTPTEEVAQPTVEAPKKNTCTE